MEAGVLNQAWAVTLPESSVSALWQVWDVAGISVCAQGDCIWLRGEGLDEGLRQKLLALPALARYRVGPEQALIPWGKIVPQGTLPEEPWLPLKAWFGLSLPTASGAWTRPTGVALTLVRVSREQKIGALLTDWPEWELYAQTCPQIRMDGLAFAASADGLALLRGEHLPPLPGSRLTDSKGILIPAGWSWSPAVDVATVREVLGLAPNECALWRESGSWSRILPDDWVKGTRSAVRATSRELQHD